MNFWAIDHPLLVRTPLRTAGFPRAWERDPDPLDDPAPMEGESLRFTRSNSTKRPCAQAAGGAPPIRGVRKDTQMEIDIAKDDASLRDRFRVFPIPDKLL